MPVGATCTSPHYFLFLVCYLWELVTQEQGGSCTRWEEPFCFMGVLLRPPSLGFSPRRRRPLTWLVWYLIGGFSLLGFGLLFLCSLRFFSHVTARAWNDTAADTYSRSVPISGWFEWFARKCDFWEVYSFFVSLSREMKRGYTGGLHVWDVTTLFSRVYQPGALCICRQIQGSGRRSRSTAPHAIAGSEWKRCDCATGAFRRGDPALLLAS